jgi:hypothetical protein
MCYIVGSCPADEQLATIATDGRVGKRKHACAASLQWDARGDADRAVELLSRAHAADVLDTTAMDTLALLLYKLTTTGSEQRRRELETLVADLLHARPTAIETYIALAYITLIELKATRAIYFAQVCKCFGQYSDVSACRKHALK